MKLEQSYAQALYSGTEGKHGEELNHLYKNFIALLEQRGHRSLLPRIGKSFESLLSLRKSHSEATIESPTRLSKEERKNYEEAFEKVTGKSFSFKETQNETLIGGVRITGGGVVYDASYKSSLVSLYQKIKN